MRLIDAQFLEARGAAFRGRQKELRSWAAACRVSARCDPGIEIGSTPNHMTNMAYAGTFSGDVLPPLTDDVARRLRRVKALAWILDAAFRLPGTKFRLGLDALIGLIPGGGSAVMGLVSLYIVWEAWRIGVPSRLLVRMVANVAMETAVDTVPMVGDVFDAAFKANLRNVALIERHLNGK